MRDKRVLIAGAGLSGATAARALADRGFKVTVIEKEKYNGGTVSDYKQDDYFVQRHGPHLFHTNSEKAFEFLSRFTEWFDYRHTVRADVHGKYIPVPFNFTSLRALYPLDKAEAIEKKLTAAYGSDVRVPIAELGKNGDKAIKDFAAFVYETVFKFYSAKQWGLDMSRVDPSVLTRVPVRTGNADGYFADKYQAMPKDGFSALVENMLDEPNIEVVNGVDACNLLKAEDGTLKYDGAPVDFPVIFTGRVDELFGYKFGALPYRSLRLETEKIDKSRFQPYGVINFTVSEDFTRISEFKQFTVERSESPSSVIMREYPCDYERGKGLTPYYPLPVTEAKAQYEKYGGEAGKIKHLFLCGRLACYVYVNMDKAVELALQTADKISGIYGE